MGADLNGTPSANRVHIGIFGRRNAGKSSVMNALTGQELAIVSDVRGTTTDPVQKAMELLPLGPVVIIDTPGIDDDGGELGAMRVRKSYQALNKTDLAIVVIDGANETSEDLELIKKIQAKGIPYVIFHNKTDTFPAGFESKEGHCYGSALTKAGIPELKEKVIELAKSEESDKKIVSDLLRPLDIAVLVIPIDKAAPKGRLILPQQQTIRDILDIGAVAVTVRETELAEALRKLGTKPRIVITDSQAFEQVNRDTPADVQLTSFSVLFARYKGILETAVKGALEIGRLRGGETVLISEGCTHHRQCGDIGTCKLPGWLRNFTGKDFSFEFTSGTEFPDDLSRFGIIIHCGGCMLNEREVRYRYRLAEEQGVPMTNYGTAIAFMHGILARSLEPFGDIRTLL